MSEDDDDKKVLVFPGSDRPVAVPEVIVLAAQRPYRAYKAHQSGKSWDEVAEQEKYPSAQSARADVRRYLTEGRALVTEWSRAEQLAIELASLRALQAACWEGAMEGKLPAIALAKDIIVTRIKVLRLDEASTEEEDRARTVVIQGESESYISALRDASND